MSSALAELPGPVQWTVDQFINALNDLVARADQQRAEISMGNAAVIELDQEADQILDPAKKAEVKAAVKAAYDKQVDAASHYRTFTAKYTDLVKQAESWMASQGLNHSAPQLGGLGLAVIIVPVVVIGIYLTALAIISYLEKTTAINKTQVDEKVKLVNAYLAGQIGPDQFKSANASLDHTLDQSRPADPFGFGQLGQVLVPVALIIGAAVIIPPLVNALTAGRRAAA